MWAWVVEEGAVTEAEEKVEMVEMVEARRGCGGPEHKCLVSRPCNRCRRGRPDVYQMENSTVRWHPPHAFMSPAGQLAVLG